MLRSLVILCLFLSFIYANTLFEPYETTLIDVTQGSATIEDSDNIVIGSSGIVIHRFDDEKNTIIARASVVEKKDGVAKVRFEVFDLLEQPALPLPGVMPEKGDKIILNFLYSRALIVAPNQVVYKEIVEHFNETTWIHPDIIGAKLAIDYRPNPDREDFKEVCKENSAGIVFFALNKKGYVVDCQSFKILKTFNSGNIAEYELPFYTRVEGIKTVFWKWNSSYITDYNRHYGNLMVP